MRELGGTGLARGQGMGSSGQGLEWRSAGHLAGVQGKNLSPATTTLSVHLCMCVCWSQAFSFFKIPREVHVEPHQRVGENWSFGLGCLPEAQPGGLPGVGALQ